MSYTLENIAELVKGDLVGDGRTVVKGVSAIEEAKEGDIAFVLNSKYEALIGSTRASCVVVPRNIKNSHGKHLIKVDNPTAAFSKIIDHLYPGRIPHPKGIHPSAIISKTAKIGKGAAIGAYTVIEDGVVLGDNTIIYPLCFIGKNTKIGGGSILYPNVTVREEIAIGKRVIIHPGTVIGSDGFGYDTTAQGIHVKIPQLGVVIIEDDVELGAAVTVDRAAFARTVIGKGSKIDNLVQIAHNVIIGPNCIIAAQTGISGSSRLGRNVVLGGQVGIADHLEIGDFVRAGAKTGISKSFPANTVLFWYPAKPVDKAREIIASIGLLPKLYKRVRALEAKIKELEK